MGLRSRIKSLERGSAEAAAAAAACPVCHDEGGGRIEVFLLARPGQKVDPRPSREGCPACGRLAASRLTILLRDPGGRVPPTV